MKRILIVAEWIKLSGGVTRTLIELLKRLSPEEYETTLYVLRPDKSELSAVPSHIRVITNDFDLPYLGARRVLARLLGQWSVGDVLAYMGAVARWKSGGTRAAYLKFFVNRHPRLSGEYDVAASYAMLDSYSNQYVAEGVKASRKIMWCHTDTALYSDRALSGLERVFERFDAINCVSRGAAVSLHHRFPTLNDRLRVRYNLMDEDKIRHLSSEPAPMAPQGVTVLTTVARISPEKGIDLLVEVAGRLRDAGHNFLWWVVGPDYNLTFAAEVKARCSNSGLDEFVRFVGAQENPFRFMAACDIYVQTSRIEGFCTATGEAKILNKPVVCTNTSGADEQFENGVNGSIVSPTVNELFSETERLIDSPDVRKAYSEALGARSPSMKSSVAAFLE